jgi:hypothetical protein
MRTPKGVSWRLTELDAKNCREDSAGSSDTCSLVLDSIFYTKPLGITQEENQKSYRRCTEGISGQWSDGRPRPSRASRAGGDTRLSTGKLASRAAYNAF